MPSCLGSSVDLIMGAALCGPKNLCTYIRRLNNTFGTQFLMMLASSYVGIKGALFRFLVLIQLPYYKTYLGLSGTQYQRSLSIVTTPWAMKGLYGALSDSFPLFGYYKRYYIAFVGFVGSAACAGLALLPKEVGRQYTMAPCVLLLLVQVQVAVTDLLCEGKYVERMTQAPGCRGDLITYVWLCVAVGSLMAISVTGWIVDNGYMIWLFWALIPIAAQILLPTLLGWIPEERVPKEENNCFHTAKIKEQLPVFLMAILTAVGALGLALMGIFALDRALLIYALCTSLFLCIMGFLCLPRPLAKCLLFMFLQDATYISISGAMDYWFTASPQCLPNGPHFSFTFYQTWGGIVGVIAASLALWLFQTVLSKGKYRAMFWLTTLFKVVASLGDIAIITRSNLGWGISDHSFFLLGDAVVLNIVVMLNFLPAMMLIAQMCPKNMESTVYAILAGMSNFGGSVSGAVGSVAMTAFQIDTSTCQFDNLVPLVIVCHCFLPLAMIPLTFLLVPDISPMDGEVYKEGEDIHLVDSFEASHQSEDIPEAKQMLSPLDSSRSRL